jgi:NADH-quinone oxidoreductase subunit E
VTPPTGGASVPAVESGELDLPPVSDETRARIERARDRYPQPKSAILPALWAIQDQYGWLPPAGMVVVGELLGLRPSEVQAVSTFYSMYFQRPAGRHHVLVCVNTSCALRGADELCAYLESSLGVPSKGTTPDGEFTWEATIECLGACGYAPMMQIDHIFHEFLTTPERIDAAIAGVRGAPAHGMQAEHAETLEVLAPGAEESPQAAPRDPAAAAEQRAVDQRRRRGKRRSP